MAYEKSFADGVREHATDDSPKGAVISSIMQARDQVLKAMDNKTSGRQGKSTKHLRPTNRGAVRGQQRWRKHAT
jgi:hypothetical protein